MTEAQKQKLIQSVRENVTEFAQAIDMFRSLDARLTALEAEKLFRLEDFKDADEGLTPEDLLEGVALVRGVLAGMPDGAAKVIHRLVY